MPVNRGTNQGIKPLGQSRDPGGPISDPGRSADAGLVTLHALGVHYLFAAALANKACPIDWLDPVAARLVDHICDCALDFEIREVGIAAMRRHLPNAPERILGEARESLRRTLVPGILVADFRCAVRARAMARNAPRFYDLFSTAVNTLCPR